MGVVNMVAINKDRLRELEQAEALLSCLQGFGVDNWSGYSDAIAAYEDEQDIGD